MSGFALTPVLLLKLALVPLLMLAITQAGLRWGAGVAGWLSGFPVIAGPVLLFVALDHGSAFTAHAALATLANVPANLAFGLCYAWCATRLPCWLCWPLGTAMFFFATALLLQLPLSLPLACAVTAPMLLLAPRLYPDTQASTARKVGNSEMICRMLAGGLVAFGISVFAERMGARWAGSLAVFPVLGSLLAAFTQASCGPAAAAQLLRGQAFGLVAFSVFCLVLFCLLPHGTALAFTASLLAAGATQRLSLAIMRRQVLARHSHR